MQKKVIDWLYNLQSRWGILKEEERSLYEYAYRLLLSRILIYSIIIALGIITGNWLEMFSFLLPFVILRQYVGGIHLKRSVSCICVSGFLIFICGKYLAINSPSGRLNPFYRSCSFFFCSGSISTPSPSSNST